MIFTIKDWINYQIETIAKAINYLDNDKVEWEIDFNDKKQQKHYPYFEKINNGLVFHDSFFSYYYFVGQVAFWQR